MRLEVTILDGLREVLADMELLKHHQNLLQISAPTEVPAGRFPRSAFCPAPASKEARNGMFYSLENHQAEHLPSVQVVEEGCALLVLANCDLVAVQPLKRRRKGDL